MWRCSCAAVQVLMLLALLLTICLSAKLTSGVAQDSMASTALQASPDCAESFSYLQALRPVFMGSCSSTQALKPNCMDSCSSVQP